MRASHASMRDEIEVDRRMKMHSVLDVWRERELLSRVKNINGRDCFHVNGLSSRIWCTG